MELENIKSPQDIKRLDIKDLEGVCDLIRAKIISAVEESGGHLSSNLGAVELITALHYVFNCPTDKFVFDVGHQAYTHKILTGRLDGFDKLRKNGGISGFPKPEESEYDCFATGHSSTSLSVALGLSTAAKLKGEHYSTVAVIGDGALTGGMAYEALNEIGSEQLPVIIVLNDNEMSISKNVGAMSKHLTRLRVSKRYAKMKSEIKRAVSTIPLLGDGIIYLLDKSKKILKRIVLSNKMFEAMGISYYGPFDGHNIRELVEVFSQVKNTKTPVIVHVLTDKGHGHFGAINDPAHSHGVSGAEKSSGKLFSDILGKFLVEAAEKDDKIVAITAAMAIGTGLEEFAEKYPTRFKDVGIAEEHAVTLGAALASAGIKPYFAVYSTFLQRGFDQILHDVCIGGYPVKLCVDRAGAVGADGVTHQGVFDISYLSLIPGMTVMSPSDGAEFRQMLDYSLTFDKPLAIRYPKSYSIDRDHAPIEYGKWETIRSDKSNVYVLAAGSRALEVAEKSAESVKMNLVNCRFIKPLDTGFLDSINKKGNVIITVEDNVGRGGFGESVLSYLNGTSLNATVKILAHPDKFIDDRDVNSTLAGSGISAENLTDIVKNLE
ncbi:MAG: 1-deoxy-D-xylulose-5-phosphate synthase [Clostridiales bacterium]|nr:1-deoxy-D-xylulose-5-phosphate synthase [Clostridiales bacterium]